MTKAILILPAVLFVLAGCMTAATLDSSTSPGAAKQSATSTAPAPDQADQVRPEAPHRNPKMDGPPGY
ncbi:uncharacterized protein YceK [Paraburkholderia bannensis]|uniref:Uncharacterized protein YceK n=1 Tax=Paraburkholderia bannensis TaxID=765414 RepID=A0A7W9WSG8_9BURK|nr:uncharacterized protein YceK [Paraburkholderia sp. WP4_3_2]MBB6102251.1 uncharacterized protein YceK [Paraburkholderia bannensis]